jgi:hypothetical protein
MCVEGKIAKHGQHDILLLGSGSPLGSPLPKRGYAVKVLALLDKINSPSLSKVFISSTDCAANL